MTIATKMKRLNNGRLMSIDPSVNNLGLAIWDMNPIQIVLHKLVHPTIISRENQYEKAWSMLEQIKQWKISYDVTRIICEVPELWVVGGFEARETGSMDKLSFVCGLLYSLRSEVEDYMLVTPRQWKGQLTKKVMCARLRDEYLGSGIDLMKIDANIADGIGIGHFYLHGRV